MTILYYFILLDHLIEFIQHYTVNTSKKKFFEDGFEG